jgi:hypothetical protein
MNPFIHHPQVVMGLAIHLTNQRARKNLEVEAKAVRKVKEELVEIVIKRNLNKLIFFCYNN